MLNYDLIEKSTMPERFKTSLLKDMKFIETEHPGGLLQVLLFGSLARSKITHKSDIDLCLVFEDGTEMTSREMRIFRSCLRGASLDDGGDVETDVVTCTRSRLDAETCLLYKEINRDKVVLGSWETSG